MNTGDRQTSQTQEKHIANTNTRSLFRWLDAQFPDARPTSILFIGNMTVSISNYVFNFLFGHLMSPGDYGLLISLLSLAAIFSSPITSVNMLITQRAATTEESKQPAVIRRSLAQALRWSIALTIILAIIIGVGADWLQTLLNVPETTFLILVAFLVVASFLLGIASGLVRGLERFGLLSISLIVQGLSRIGLGLGLLGLGVAGVMSATPLSYLLGTLICVGSLIPILRRKTVDAPATDSPGVSHLIYLIVVQAIIGLLLNSDVIIARRFLTPQDSGLYAALSILGKTILYLAATVGDVVYPRISRQIKHGIQEQPFKLLIPGAAIVLGAAAPVIGLFSLFPKQIITILYGKQYLAVSPLLGAYGLAMLPLAVNGVLSQYFIAARSKIYVILGGLAVLIQWGILSTVSVSLSRIVLVVGLVNAVFVIIVLALSLRPAAFTK